MPHANPPASTHSPHAVILSRFWLRISVDDYQACSGDCFKSAEGASYTSMGRSPMDDRPNRIRGPKARSIPSGHERAAHQRPSIGPAGASLIIISPYFAFAPCLSFRSAPGVPGERSLLAGVGSGGICCYYSSPILRPPGSSTVTAVTVLRSGWGYLSPASCRWKTGLFAVRVAESRWLAHFPESLHRSLKRDPP